MLQPAHPQVDPVVGGGVPRGASEKDRRCGESEQVKVGIQDGRSLWVWNLIESVVSEFGAVASVLGCVGGWAGVQVWLLLLS